MQVVKEGEWTHLVLVAAYKQYSIIVAAYKQWTDMKEKLSMGNQLMSEKHRLSEELFYIV